MFPILIGGISYKSHFLLRSRYHLETNNQLAYQASPNLLDVSVTFDTKNNVKLHWNFVDMIWSI